ncbi:ADP-ribosyltransferase [Ekhidna sp.]|uniref:ADP-ribosyltransferase n=1 Tax=Ekhidna sp. TaxID=2608089 RepID=UPI003514AE02
MKINDHLKYIGRLLLAMVLLSTSVSTPAQDLEDANKKAGEDTKRFFSYFTDWVMLSHIHRSGENAADVDNIFNAFVKDYADNAILREILNTFNTSELGTNAELFFQSTGIRVYFVGEMDVSKADPRFEPIFSHLNNSLRAKIENTTAPYIIVTNKLSGDNDAGYSIATSVRYSNEIKAGKYNLDKTDSSNPFLASLTTSATKRNDAGRQIRDAMLAGLNTLQEVVKENYLPPLLISYQDKFYKSGETIETAVLKDATVTLVAIDDEQNTPSRQVEWTISPQNEQTTKASIDGNRLVFPIDVGGDYAIQARAGSDEVNITLSVKGLGQDLRDLLKKLLLEELAPRLETAMQNRANLKSDSTRITSELTSNLEEVEDGNFPLEGSGGQLSVLKEPTALTDTSLFYQSEVRTKTFTSLRRQKNIVGRLQKAYQLVSYIDKVLNENDQEVKDLVDALVENSGELLAQFVITGLSREDSTAMKDIVATFLDNNLGELAGTTGESAFATFLESIDPPQTFPPDYQQGANYYISPLVPLEDRAQIIANIETYQAGQEIPTFVVINYSQDVSMESYLARTPTGAPKGLAAGQDYVVINYVNIPGSVEEAIFIEGDEEVANSIMDGEYYAVLEALYLDVKGEYGEEGAINEFVEKLQKIVEWLEECNEENFASYKGEGIIPYCFWRDWNLDDDYKYSVVDAPMWSGVIDGGYQEIKGILDLIEMIKEVPEAIGDLAYAYSYWYISCQPGTINLTKARYKYIINRLVEEEQEGGAISWLKEKYYTKEKEWIEGVWDECEEAYETIEPVNEFFNLITKGETYEQLWVSLKEYWGTLSGTDNIARYEQGKLLIPVGSTFIPAVGQLSKWKRVEKILDGIKALSKSKLDDLARAIQRIRSLGLKNFDDLSDALWSKIVKWSDEDLLKLDDDLVHLKSSFNSNPELVEAWKVISNSPNRTDIDFLKFFDNADVVNARRVVDEANIKSKFPDMSVEELTSIYHYTTDAYYDLNRALRGLDPMTEQFDAFNKALNKSMDKLPKYSQPVYRGTVLPESVLAKYKNAFDNGSEVIEDAFMSTSKDLDVAKSFADDFAQTGETKVFLEINGKNGVDIEDISAYGPSFDPSYSESEILFKSGSKFKVENYVEDVLPNGEKFISIKLVE